jgi:hypothetical protein
MRYVIISDLGGFLWWLLIKFCRTNLLEEQGEDKWARNIFFLCMLGIITAIVVIKFF